MTTRRPRARGAGFARSRAPKRRGVWIDDEINETVTLADQTVVQLDNLLLPEFKKGVTLVRLILELVCVAITAGAGSRLHAGITIVTQDAFAALAIPEPGDSGDEVSWLWRQIGKPVFTSVVNDSSQSVTVSRDLKSKRRYPGEDYNLTLVMDAVGASSVNVDGLIRLYYLLP